jgi:hypothetical protein
MARLFGIGHLVLRSGRVAYAARYRMVVVELRNHTTYTQEIPVTYQGKDAYVEPLSLVVQRSATPVKCRKKTPPRWRIGKEWICGYPEIRPCNGPEPFPGHHRTKILKARGAVEFDPVKGADEARPERNQGGDIDQETLEALAAGISSHWMGGYESLGSLPGVIGTAVMGVSAVEMVTSTVVRMSVLYTLRGPGLWMMAAFWGTAFQVITMPSRWALEWGQAQGEAVSQAIEARVGGANLPIEGGGTASKNLSRISSGKNTGPARLLLQCSGGVCRGGYFLLPYNE